MPIRRDEDCSCINANSIYMYDKTVAPKTLGAISFIILTEPFVTLQCDEELRRISFEDYGSEITKITIHIYPPPLSIQIYVMHQVDVSDKLQM